MNKIFILAIILLCVIFYIFGDFIWQGFAEEIWGDTRVYESEYGGISTFILLVFISIATLIFYPNILKGKRGRLQDNINVEDELFFKMLLL